MGLPLQLYILIVAVGSFLKVHRKTDTTFLIRTRIQG